MNALDSFQCFSSISLQQEYDVELTKGAKGLGFTVAGGANSTGFFYVKDVLYDPALSSGLIQPGDRLIQVRKNHKLDLLLSLHLLYPRLMITPVFYYSLHTSIQPLFYVLVILKPDIPGCPRTIGQSRGENDIEWFWVDT